MKPHKWAKEIHAWADGATIEQKFRDDSYWEKFDGEWVEDEDWAYQVKPQPKEPQYLYVYGNEYVTITSIEKASDCGGVPYIGSIEVKDRR